MSNATSAQVNAIPQRINTLLGVLSTDLVIGSCVGSIIGIVVEFVFAPSLFIPGMIGILCAALGFGGGVVYFRIHDHQNVGKVSEKAVAVVVDRA
jgi:hypothetical protein